MPTHATILSNANTADVVADAVDTYLAGSSVTVGTRIKVGTRIIWKLAVTKTAAGIVAPIFNVRFGTAGTVADAARHTFTGVAQTAATDVGMIEIMCVVRSVSATGTTSSIFNFEHFNAITGFADKAQAQIIQSTSAAYDNTAAGLIAGLSVIPGTLGVWTFQVVSVDVTNLV